MKNKEFYYVVCQNNSTKEFKKTCKKLESSEIMKEFDKQELIADVDGSTIQVYTNKGKEIIVIDDYDFGYIYINSDIDLSAVLEKKESAA